MSFIPSYCKLYLPWLGVLPSGNFPTKRNRDVYVTKMYSSKCSSTWAPSVLVKEERLKGGFRMLVDLF